VTDKNLILYEPNGGEDYPALSSQNISWDHGGLTNLNLYYTYDDGTSWNLIASTIPASSLGYTWQVPETPSVNCRIKLQDQTHSYMVLESDTNFSITPLQVIAPTVDFEADIQSGDIPLAVQFSETINPGVGSVSSRLWDFGDGITSGLSYPLHTYTAAGTYTVSLTVSNDFGGSATETKTDYIVALPKTPRIELFSASTLGYGTVYLGDSSAPQAIQLKNIGTAPLNIASVSYYLTSGQFALAGTTLPIVIPVNGTATLNVVFTPSTNGAVSDSLFIHSDASNLPVMAIKLTGTGEYVPPAMVEGVEVDIEGDDAIISWQPVTETIYGTPIVPDGYIVLYIESPYEHDDHLYYFLNFVTGTSYNHTYVAQFRTQMFYRVVAVKFYREGEGDALAALNSSKEKILWSELKTRLAKVRDKQ
jgi:PKD repeat protein